MSQDKRQLNEIFERVTSDIKNESIDSAIVNSASDRVWSRLHKKAAETGEFAGTGQIRSCADFQALIPAYLTGSLLSARALLFEDHTHECIPCRKALKQARTGAEVNAESAGIEPLRSAARRTPAVKWAIAAVIVVLVGLAGVFSFQRFSRSAADLRAIVNTMTGPVYLISDAGVKPVDSGQQIRGGDRIRTAKNATALISLRDGSVIEARERTEFSVTEDSSGTTIHLERGNIIVQAAKQHERNLFVATNDCLVSVKGTIFSVNNGTKGSRVSVVEGRVEVDYAGEKRALDPGEQISTSQVLERIPIRQEIAWSRDAERYNRLLSELAALRKDLDERVSRPAVRYSTRLLNLAPDGTVIYLAIPNLTATIEESRRIIEERLNDSPELREWWQKEQNESGRPGLSHIVDKVREFGGFLGDEIVVSAAMDQRGEPGEPIVLADLRDPDGFRNLLEREILSSKSDSKKESPIKIIDNPLSQTDGSGPRDSVLVWINGDILAAAPKLAPLQRLAASLNTPGANGFVGSPFHSRIAGLYEEGAGLIVAADLEKIIADVASEPRQGASKRAPFSELGLNSLKHFVLEIKEREGKPFNRAVLSFKDQRQGIAAWLAEPGPMGALEFISPDANLVAAFVVKEPAALVGDLLNALKTIDPDLQQHLDRFEAETQLSIRDDFAKPLGGEFAIAVDGPVLPTPSWKLIMEVYDPIHFQQTLETLVEKINQWAKADGKAGFEWERTEAGGLTFYTLRSLGIGVSVSYTYANGYLIMAPSRALVDRAVRYRESGYSLLHSPKFIAVLPEDKNANFSAILYHNLGAVVGPLAKAVPGGNKLAAQMFQTGPMLAYAYARDDGITFAVNGEKGPFGLTPSTLLGLPGSFGLHHIFGEVVRK